MNLLLYVYYLLCMAVLPKTIYLCQGVAVPYDAKIQGPGSDRGYRRTSVSSTVIRAVLLDFLLLLNGR